MYRPWVKWMEKVEQRKWMKNKRERISKRCGFFMKKRGKKESWKNEKNEGEKWNNHEWKKNTKETHITKKNHDYSQKNTGNHEIIVIVNEPIILIFIRKIRLSLKRVFFLLFIYLDWFHTEWISTWQEDPNSDHHRSSSSWWKQSTLFWLLVIFASSRQVNESLTQTEKNIFDLETQYLEETYETGNFSRGWEGFIDKYVSRAENVIAG